MEAFREIFWNVPLAPYIFYTLGILSVGAIIYAIYRRVQLWNIGKPEKRTDSLGARIIDFISEAIINGIVHKKFFRDPYPGIMHFLLFIGAALLLIGTALDVINHYIVHFLVGNVYLGVSFAADLGGVMMLIGVIMAFVRRYIQKPDRLKTIFDDGVVQSLIFVVVLTGFFVEGFRMLIAVPEGLSAPEFYAHPEWAIWSFGGYIIAKAFSGASESARLLTYLALYWFHALLVFGSIFYVAFSFSKLSHIVISPINVFFKSRKPKGALNKIDLENAEYFGVNKIENFTWKQILDLDACTNCGRCQDRCPAYLSGKPLSPRKIIQDLKTDWLARAKDFVKKKDSEESTQQQEVIDVLVGRVITEDELWSCTTCRACQDICPVSVEHIDKIVDMRRNMVLEQAKMPETGEGILKCIEARGHTCRGTTFTRTDWMSGLDIKTLSDSREIDVLFWVGCAPALENRNMKVAVATAKILLQAGVKFGVLGEEESCCGEPARRLGNEYLFQMQALRNIEVLKNYGVERIVTICPHCYNTLKNEYPQFDGKFQVLHHTQFILDLVRQGKLGLEKGDFKLTFHDSCYLGRHNDIYDEPRQLIRGANKAGIIEMERSRNNGFCCGGGGGRFWMEERIGKRISEMRIEHVINTGAEMVASACPYCLQMFEDAIKAKGMEEKLKAMDISEILVSLCKK